MSNIFTSPGFSNNQWTPTDASGAGLTWTDKYGNYRQVGDIVFVNGYVQFPSTTNTSPVRIGGLPVAVSTTTNFLGLAVTAANVAVIAQFTEGTSDIYIKAPVGDATTIFNSTLSGNYLWFSGFYFTDAD